MIVNVLFICFGVLTVASLVGLIDVPLAACGCGFVVLGLVRSSADQMEKVGMVRAFRSAISRTAKGKALKKWQASLEKSRKA